MRLSLAPVGGILLVALVALALLAVLAIRPSREKTTPRQRLCLFALRLAAVLLVIAAMLRPTVVFTSTKRQAATLIVLADQSKSMMVADAFGDRPRWEALQATLNASADKLSSLAEDLEVKIVAFDATAEGVDFTRRGVNLPETATGEQTAIGAVLDDVLRNEAGKRLAAVLLLSDGAQRALSPRDLPPQIAARRMADLGTPLYAFTFGQARGIGQGRDVAVRELNVNPTVFVKNELGVTGTIRVDGFAGDEIPVQLLFETAPGEMEVVGATRLRATQDGQQLPIELSYAPQTPGEYKVTLSAVPRPGEVVTTNNELSTFVSVLKGGLNVLYLEGALRVEQKFLRRALDGSPDIEVDYLRIDARHPETRPPDLAERFEPGRYDVYILGDLDALALDDEHHAALAEAVRRGAGLIMIGGFHSFGPGGYDGTPLADVLPIEMEPHERQRFDEGISADLHLGGTPAIRPTTVGQRHYVMLLATPDRNAELWAELPPLDGANRFRGLKPRAQVLAESDAGDPLLVAHDLGSGRVMAFAGDSTWRWWLHGFEDEHRRFWRQIVLWLAHKDQADDGDVWLRLAPRRYRPGSRVEFTAGLEGAASELLDTTRLAAQVVLPDGHREPVRLVRQGDEFVGSLASTTAIGDYAIEVEAVRDAAPIGQARARFLVYQEELELDNPAADPTLMANLAATTGGESLSPEELPTLLDRLRQQTEELEIETQVKRPLWDGWPLFGLLTGLLGVEWWLRKRWGLV